MNKSLTLGSDPELHIFDTDEGRIVSSIPILKRDKTNPIELGDGIKAYHDNVLAEISFPPSSSADGVIKTLRESFLRTQEHIGPRYALLPRAYHTYEESELQAKQAKEVGCNPNFDVYNQVANQPANFVDGGRSGSFHIHIGHPKMIEMEDKEMAIKLLDVFLGCPSVIFDRDETAHQRRRLYGKAGEFRPTSYGVEYRVLGNYALRSPRLVEIVFDLVDKVVEMVEAGTGKDLLESLDCDTIRSAINDNDQAKARMVMLASGLSSKMISRIQEERMPAMQKEWSL